MNARLVIGCTLIALALVGCERQPPVGRGRAAVIADNLQRQLGVAWGDPTEILEPTTSTDSHAWWQLRYRNNQVILVDAASGWGRLPPPDYQPRIRTRSETLPASAPTVVDGSLVLRLTEPQKLAPEALGELEREAAQLNVIAAQTSLHPLFSVRTDRQGQSALLYGWQGDRGVARDEQAADWVRVRTTHHQPVWVELLPER